MAYTYNKIVSVTVGSGGAATIDFTAIPQYFTDLKIVFSARTTSTNTAATNYIYLNGVVTNRTLKALYGTDTTAGTFTNTGGISGDVNGNGSTASVFSNQEIYIPNYTSTTDYKSFSVDAVVEQNMTGPNNTIEVMAQLWSSSAAITSITLSPTPDSYMQYTTATLYGIRKS